MNSIIVLVVSLAAGLHAALYGAYKDSPHESFRTTRFVRELAIATVIGLGIITLHRHDGCSPFVLFLLVFALSRIVTEFYKIFLRRETQERFRIPTQLHFIRHVIGNMPIRIVAGTGWLAGAYGLYSLPKLPPDSRRCTSRERPQAFSRAWASPCAERTRTAVTKGSTFISS